MSFVKPMVPPGRRKRAKPRQEEAETVTVQVDGKRLAASFAAISVSASDFSEAVKKAVDTLSRTGFAGTNRFLEPDKSDD